MVNILEILFVKKSLQDRFIAIKRKLEVLWQWVGRYSDVQETLFS